MPLELKQQRILPLTIGGTVYRYTIRPVGREEYLQYFDSVIAEDRKQEDGTVSRSVDTSGRLPLLSRVLLAVDGYTTEDDKPITEIQGWQELLPVSHRETFADLLFRCGTDKAVSSPVMIGAESVTLQAAWTADDSGKTLLTYAGLKHIFRVPSVEQARRYGRDSSRSVIHGGRKGSTQYVGVQRTLVDLYDDLIVRVEGYTADGTALDRNRDLIVATMDTYHKAQAMGAVFAPPAIDEEV